MAKRILFISYFFPPFDSVGVKRIAYWHKNISNYGLESMVFTAIKQNEKSKNIVYVEPEDNNNLLSYFIKDKGVNWINPLKSKLKEFEQNDFDFVIISGGPFMQMLITKYLKTHFKTKIILDFRDPFYANPRFPSNRIKDLIKLFFQTKFLKYSDVVITVNSECASLIKHTNIRIIDNGYDETILNKIENHNTTIPNSNFTAIATGKIYEDFNINPFFKALNKRRQILFEYIGNHQFKQNKELYNHGGFLQYESALRYINKADFCVLFTGGMPFESSTKIFDYLGLNKTILIITEGNPKTGSLHQITKNYPNIFWSRNNENDILKAFDTIIYHENIKVDTSVYSRAEGLKILTQILSL